MGVIGQRARVGSGASAASTAGMGGSAGTGSASGEGGGGSSTGPRAPRWRPHAAPPSTPHGRPRAGAGAGSGSDAASRARMGCGGGAGVSSFRRQVVCAARAPRSAERPKVFRRAVGGAERQDVVPFRPTGATAGVRGARAGRPVCTSKPIARVARAQRAAQRPDLWFAARSEWPKGRTWCPFGSQGRLPECGRRAP